MVTVMPGDTAALRPCAALTLGDSNTHSSEEVISKDSQNCLEVMGVQRVLGIPGRNRGGPGAQGCELPGILRVVRSQASFDVHSGWSGKGQTEVHRA